DVLELSHGGKLKGQLKRVTFFAGGEEKAFARGAIERFRVAKAGKDELTLKDGTVLEGEFVKLAFRSVGGLLEFRRKDVKGLTFVESEADKFRKTLAAKKGELAEDDAAGHAELADWCREHGLKAEATQLARASLELDEDGEKTALAHEILGHVQYEGEWLTPAEVARRKGEEKDEKDPEPAPKTKPDAAKLKAALARNEQFYRSYRDKVARLRKEEFERAKSHYKEKWASTERRRRQIEAQIKPLRDDYHDAVRFYMEWAGTSKAEAKQHVEKSSALKRGLRQLAELDDEFKKIKIGAKKSVVGVADRAKTRTKQVRQAYNRINDALYLKREVSRQKMKQAYEAALRLD
ncbi:MAG: hypothetical protein R6V58_14905, partial [Planctomycetota bacterium]